MKLTEEQIDLIDRYLEQKKLDFLDFKLEIRDHLATATEIIMEQKNSSADISPTAGQMPRLLGLAQASKVYRNHPTLKDLEQFKKFTNGGNEVAFGTIGNGAADAGTPTCERRAHCVRAMWCTL